MRGRARTTNEPVCFRRTTVMVLLASLAGARGAARFGAVIDKPACGSVQATARVRLAPYLSREMFGAHPRTIPAVRSALRLEADGS
jgi:hypothetical protein